MNINLHPEGSKFILGVGLVDENFTFIHIYIIIITYHLNIPQYIFPKSNTVHMIINHTGNKILY
jgi:hypothetical protein